MKSLQEIVKVYRIGDASKLLRCCAYDSDISPDKNDNIITISGSSSLLAVAVVNKFCCNCSLPFNSWTIFCLSLAHHGSV